MQIEDCYYLGTITRKHGYKGDLLLKLDTDEPEYYINLESILVEQSGILVPFFLNKADLHKEQNLIIQPEELESAELLVGRDVYLPLSSLPKLTGNKFYYHEVVGFQVIDKNLGEIGIIESIRENNAQDLFEIQTKEEKQILIPIIDEWLIEVNREEKFIKVQTPDGLLNIF